MTAEDDLLVVCARALAKVERDGARERAILPHEVEVALDRLDEEWRDWRAEVTGTRRVC
ncbi:MAG TPA: hypothetical protein VE964_12790 [Myxococcales bacterium]|nr:hypothetical protein [Myxococcales bacterium]